MARAMAHPVAYPMAYPKFCNLTNYKEKTTTYVKKGQALHIRALAAIFFYQIRPQSVPARKTPSWTQGTEIWWRKLACVASHIGKAGKTSGEAVLSLSLRLLAASPLSQGA